MAFGCFVDIRQQDGSLVRMNYAFTQQNLQFCKWVGVMELTADKFRNSEKEKENLCTASSNTES
jgi:hypothetical protein